MHARRQLRQPLGAFLALSIDVVRHQQPRTAQQVAQLPGTHTSVVTAECGQPNQVASFLLQPQRVELALDQDGRLTWNQRVGPEQARVAALVARYFGCCRLVRSFSASQLRRGHS